MGLRDRLKGLLQPPPPPAQAPVARPALVRPALATRRAPRAVGRDALDRAIVLDARRAGGTLPGAVRATDLRNFHPGRPVVVVCEDGGWSAGVAERLCALGVEADWLDGGWST